MVVESQAFGTEEAETLPLQQCELEALAKNFQEEPDIPSAPPVPCQ